MTIAAFVFALERDVEIVTNHEVAETLWCPLAPVARPAVTEQVATSSLRAIPAVRSE